MLKKQQQTWLAIAAMSFLFPAQVWASPSPLDLTMAGTKVTSEQIGKSHQDQPQVSAGENLVEKANTVNKTTANTKAQPNAKKIKPPVKKIVRILPPDYQNITIEGEAIATRQQAVNYIKQGNPKAKLTCSVEKIVDYYYEESTKEGLRADLVLSQALLETGFFTFNGTVKPEQNNFCGLGTTSAIVKGASFKTPQLGVRAHVQHLLAYTAERLPKSKIVDPRYDLVHRMRKNAGFYTKWYDLNGKWAMSPEYSEKIFDVRSKMLGLTSATVGTAIVDQTTAATAPQPFSERIKKTMDELKKSTRP
ncbi:MAG: glucosaminidase domain-containing protein [Acidaminococcaceae bacterium]